jgi:hypothetical protein
VCAAVCDVCGIAHRNGQRRSLYPSPSGPVLRPQTSGLEKSASKQQKIKLKDALAVRCEQDILVA